MTRFRGMGTSVSTPVEVEFRNTLKTHTHTHTIEARFNINPQINNRADGQSLCDINRCPIKHDNDNSQTYYEPLEGIQSILDNFSQK